MSSPRALRLSWKDGKGRTLSDYRRRIPLATATGYSAPGLGRPFTGLVWVRFCALGCGGGFRSPGGSQARKDQTRSYPRTEATLSSGTSRAAPESGLLESGTLGRARAARS